MPSYYKQMVISAIYAKFMALFDLIIIIFQTIDDLEKYKLIFLQCMRSGFVVK